MFTYKVLSVEIFGNLIESASVVLHKNGQNTFIYLRSCRYKNTLDE